MNEPTRDIFMVHVNWAGSVFVKTYDFYKSQGGFREEWGKVWVPVVAHSISDARREGCKLPGARPIERQAPEE